MTAIPAHHELLSFALVLAQSSFTFKASCNSQALYIYRKHKQVGRATLKFLPIVASEPNTLIHNEL